MRFRFSCDQPIRWSDIDAAGVINNAVYLSLVEQARYLYFQHLGIVEDARVPFLLGETSVRFHRPGRMGSQVRVFARTTRLGNKSFTMEYEVHHGEDLLATVGATMVCVDDSMNSVEMPPALREAVAAFEGIPEREA